MSIINSFKSPQMFRKNDENNVPHKLTLKQDTGGVKQKKKALADVGNIVHQRNKNCDGTKALGNLKSKISENIQKTKSSPSSYIPQTCKDDTILCNNHNWSICDKYNDGDKDGFLPNLELTPQQLDSYVLDWDIKPKYNSLKLKEIDEIKAPKSPEWFSINQVSDDQWSNITSNYNLMTPVV